MALRGLMFLCLMALVLFCLFLPPVAAQSGGLQITGFDITLGYGISEDAQEVWLEHFWVAAFDPEGGDHITHVRFEAPGGLVIDKTPATADPDYWIVDGSYANVGGFRWGPTTPTLGQYRIIVYNGSGESAEVLSHEPARIPDRAPTPVWPLVGGTVTDTQPILWAEPVQSGLPYPDQSYGMLVHGPQEEWASRNCVWRAGSLPELKVRFNADGAAGVPELTPGTTYTVAFFHCDGGVVDPGAAAYQSRRRGSS